MNRCYRILYFVLLVVSCGFYTLPVSAGECPGHPKGPSEMHEENERHKRKNDPARQAGNEKQRRDHDRGRSRCVTYDASPKNK